MPYRYAYVLNDPVDFVDPLGLAPPCDDGFQPHVVDVTRSSGTWYDDYFWAGGIAGIGQLGELVTGGDGKCHDAQRKGGNGGASGGGTGSPQLKCAIQAAQGASPAAALSVQNVPILGDLLGNSAADTTELALNIYDAANGSSDSFESAVRSFLSGQLKDGARDIFTAAVIFRNKAITKSFNKGFSPRTNLTKQFAKFAGKAKIAADFLVFATAYLYSCSAFAE